MTSKLGRGALGLIITWVFALAAQSTEAAEPDLAVPLPAACAAKTDVLGLSRVVEIDTTAGPRFGASQYKDNAFLEDGEVVLTFDDGPAHKYTLAVLDALDAECTRATFFPVGRMALADPETLREVAKRGHTVGLHSWSHKNFKSISTAKGKEEIELGLSAVNHVLGAPPAPFFRFPYLADTKTALSHLETRNLGVFSIEVDSRDFTTRNPGNVLRNVVNQLKTARKGIILFHDLQPSTASAMPSVLAALRTGGFKVVHLIPKAPAATLPEYDAVLAKEFERRKGVVASAAVSEAAAGAAKGTEASGQATPKGDTPPVAASDGPKPRPRAKKPFWRPAGDDWQLRGYIGDE